MDLIGAKREEILSVSAKEGTGVPALLEAIVKRVPHPRGRESAPLRALIFDSYYDRYRGAIPSIRVVDGTVRPGMEIAFGSHPDEVFRVDEVGLPPAGPAPADRARGRRGRLPGGQPARRAATPASATPSSTPRTAPPSCCPAIATSSRWCSPASTRPTPTSTKNLRDALEKLRLNDASLNYEPESSTALGFGFRCGFLGLLHLEIVQERLEREFNLDLITTVPTVEYHVYRTDGEMLVLSNPTNLPDPADHRPDRGAVREGAHHGARPTTSAAS